MIKAFISLAVTLAVVHCYYPGALRRASLRELTQDKYDELRTGPVELSSGPEKTLADYGELRTGPVELRSGPEKMLDYYRYDDQLERRSEHGCKYPGYPCAGENYSYGCKDYTRDLGYVSI